MKFLFPGFEGLCIFLRRLAYPNRLSDLEPLFGLSAEYLSVVSKYVMNFIYEQKSHLLFDLNNLNWLDRNRMRYYARAVRNKGAALMNCWGFIDGTARPICRPSIDQENYFSGHKRHHCLKYQSVLCPDGIVASLIGPFPGRRHDAGILRDSNLYTQLEECARFDNDEKYVLYGDPAYPVMELLLCPYSGRRLTDEQQLFNTSMSSVRQAVEWGFGKIISEFAFLD